MGPWRWEKTWTREMDHFRWGVVTKTNFTPDCYYWEVLVDLGFGDYTAVTTVASGIAVTLNEAKRKVMEYKDA